MLLRRLSINFVTKKFKIQNKLLIFSAVNSVLHKLKLKTLANNMKLSIL